MCEMVVKVYHPKGDLESMVSKVVKDINEEKYKHAEREKQRMDNALAYINEELKSKDKKPSYDVNKMKQRKEAKNARKDTKNVKTAVVNQGEIEDYDIERVLQDLELNEVPKKGKSNSKKKEKKKQRKKLQIASCLNDDKPEENEASTNEVVEVDTNDKSSEMMSQEPRQRPINSAEGDCSICFCPKTRTFAFIPCFHATFCQDCSERIFNETKRCPTCQVLVTNKTRIFL